MTKVLMRSKSGAEAELPCGGTHPSVEEWCRRGWTVVEPEPAPEAGFAPVPFAPTTIDGPRRSTRAARTTSRTAPTRRT